MKKHIMLTVLLIASSLSVAIGQVALQPFEVHKPCRPQGGYELLNTFIQANVRMPFRAEADQISGRVFVQGVVGTDGRVSSLTVLRGLRPDCDREALRVFGRFNAWQPAEKDSQRVAQVVTQTIPFKSALPVYYRDGQRLAFFDQAVTQKSETDTSVVYKQVILADTNGYPTGDMVFYERKKEKWREKLRYKFASETIPQLPDVQDTTSVGKAFRRLTHRSSSFDLQGEAYTLYPDGSLAQVQQFDGGRLVGTAKTYYPNGTVAKQTTYNNGLQVELFWYPNGQLWKEETQLSDTPTVNKSGMGGPTRELINWWDSTGHRGVKDGMGQARLQTFIKSNQSNRYTVFTEQGFIANGERTGTWTGRYADGSYFYQEDYTDGVCTGGKAREAGTDTITYDKDQIQPEYIGGMSKLGQFLAMNIRYPIDAMRSRAQGRVFVSFVVCEDGSLCDHAVIKSAGNRSLDQEALRVVKQMKNNWKPGVERGRPVRVKYNLPVNFTFQ